MAARVSQDELLVNIVAVVQSQPKSRRVFTAKQVGTSALMLRGLVEERLVENTGQTQPNTDPETGKTLRGRPAHIFRPTRKGYDHARRVAATA